MNPVSKSLGRAVAIASALACWWSSAPLAHATSYVPMTDEALADQATLIVDVEVVERLVADVTGGLVTDYRVRTVRGVKGGAPAELLVRVPGGVRPDGSGLHIRAAPRFSAGARALLFLSRHADGTYRILQFMLGAFHVRDVAGRLVAGRDLAEARAVGRVSRPEVPRDLDLFVAWLRDRARGRHRPADYEVGAFSAVVSQEFTLLGPGRWTEFDGGGTVPWRAHQSGQSGMSGGGFARFVSALAAWTGDPSTPISLPYGGTTTASGGLGSADGVNAILFDDPFNQIQDSFSCTTGGTLAVGGFRSSGTVVWKGQTFSRAVEGDIVTNDGAGCFFGGHLGEDGEEVFGHELGHTLGLGHSCGDSSSGPCDTTDKQQALMRAIARGDGRGAQLGNDDRNAIIFVYQPSQAASVAFAAAGSSFAEGAGTISVTVVLSTSTGPLMSAVTVNWATVGGSATTTSDFGPGSGTITFPAGSPSGASQAIGVALVSDNIDEGNESFSVTLSGPVNASLGSPSTHVVTIVDDDPPPGMAINDVTVTEGNSGTVSAVFTVTLDRPSSQTVTVSWTTGESTATSPSDYTTTSGSLSFAPGETSKTVAVAVNGDIADEPDEVFFVFLTSPSGATIADSQGQGVINDDDPPPGIAINDVTVTEGNSGTVSAVFTVTLDRPSSQTVTVSWTTGESTATSPSDYTSASGSLSFAPGETSKMVAVAVNGDIVDEPDEVFFVFLTSPSGATIADSQGQGVINDDDPPPGIAINDVTVTEGNSGTVSAVFTVTLDRPSSQTVTVSWTTGESTATLPSDYTSASGSLSFAPGETSKTVAVAVNGDALDEPDEMFFVLLSSPSAATITDGQGQGVITDDDPTPQIAIQDCIAAEGDSGTTPCTFTLTLSGPSGATVTVSYATANGTAQAPSDYTYASGTVSFAPGQTSAPLTVFVNGDVLDEADETFVVNLSSPSGATIADSQGQATITDDDQAAASVSDASGLEGVAGPNALTFTISLSNPSVQTVTVPYSTADGSATAGSDYASASGTATFLPGEVSQIVTVTVFGDIIVEANETLFMNLGPPTNAALADGQGVGTILNDDPPTPAALADFLMLGQAQRTTLSAATTTRWFKVRLVAGRSYSATAWAPATDPSESPVSLALAWFLDDGTTPAGGATTVENEPIPDAGGHDGAAASIIPTAAQCVVPTGCTYRVRLQSTGAAASIPVKLMVVETTLASPYWAVATAAGYDAAPQIRNNTSAAIPVTFTAYGSGGGVVCTSTFTVPANGLTTFGLSGAAPGCSISSGFGSAQIAFHGPPGSITANITTFSALSGLSFDAPFRPRNTWTSLRTRTP